MSNLFYTKRLLNFADQNSQAHAARLRERFAEHAQASLWGLWRGVFGMAAHQLMAVSAHANWTMAGGLLKTVRWRADGC